MKVAREAVCRRRAGAVCSWVPPARPGVRSGSRRSTVRSPTAPVALTPRRPAIRTRRRRPSNSTARRRERLPDSDGGDLRESGSSCPRASSAIRPPCPFVRATCASRATSRRGRAASTRTTTARSTRSSAPPRSDAARQRRDGRAIRRTGLQPEPATWRGGAVRFQPRRGRRFWTRPFAATATMGSASVARRQPVKAGARSKVTLWGVPADHSHDSQRCMAFFNNDPVAGTSSLPRGRSAAAVRSDRSRGSATPWMRPTPRTSSRRRS